MLNQMEQRKKKTFKQPKHLGIDHKENIMKNGKNFENNN